MKVYVKGRPEDVTVDDLFPIYNNQAAFTKPTSDGGWWLPLLEKAYAKVNVNYEMVSSGSQVEAARFLTGAPAREFSTNFQTTDELWNQLTLVLKKDYPVTTACFVETHGLVPGQGYIVLDFVKFKRDDGNIIRLLKIKNPFKKSESLSTKALSQQLEWTGKFNKHDKFWNKENAKKAGLDNLQDGEFYIAVEEFKDVFKLYTVVYLDKTHKNSFVEKRNAVNKKTYRFNFTISEDDLPAKPIIPVEVTEAAPAPPAPEKPVIDIIAAKKPDATSTTTATINLGEVDSEDVQLPNRPPQDQVNLMLQIQERLMDDDGGEEPEEEDEDDEMQGQTADQDTS